MFVHFCQLDVWRLVGSHDFQALGGVNMTQVWMHRTSDHASFFDCSSSQVPHSILLLLVFLTVRGTWHIFVSSLGGCHYHCRAFRGKWPFPPQGLWKFYEHGRSLVASSCCSSCSRHHCGSCCLWYAAWGQNVQLLCQEVLRTRKALSSSRLCMSLVLTVFGR